MTGQRRPCDECETGACICGTGCDACHHTRICPECHGFGWIDEPPITISPSWRGGVAAVAGQNIGHRAPRRPTERTSLDGRGRPRKQAVCSACGRRERNEANAWYRGLTVEQRHRKLNEQLWTLHTPRCLACGFMIRDLTSVWAWNAAAAGTLVRFEDKGFGRFDFEHIELDSLAPAV